MDGWMMDGWMAIGMEGQTWGWMGGWMGGWVAMGLDVWLWGWMDDGWMDGHGDGWRHAVDGWMGIWGWMGGWVDGWQWGWMHGHWDGWTDMGMDVWPWGRMHVWSWGRPRGSGSRVGPGGRGHGDGGAVGSGRLRALSAPRGSRWTLKRSDSIRSVPFRSPYIRGAPPTSSPRAAPLQATPLADVIAARLRPRAKNPFPARNRRHQKAPRPALSATDVIAARRIPVIPAQP